MPVVLVVTIIPSYQVASHLLEVAVKVVATRTAKFS